VKPYQTITGWMDFEDYYSEVAMRAQAGDVLVEVGTHKGRSLAYLLERLRLFQKEVFVHGIEEDKETCRECSANLAGAELLTLHNLPSVKAAELFAENSLAFVFIDADHSYVSVCADIAAWLPKVRTGGVLAGHDYSLQNWPECYRAVNDTLGNRVKQVSRSSWMVQL